jgi:hypothetical protein
MRLHQGVQSFEYCGLDLEAWCGVKGAKKCTSRLEVNESMKEQNTTIEIH